MGKPDWWEKFHREALDYLGIAQGHHLLELVERPEFRTQLERTRFYGRCGVCAGLMAISIADLIHGRSFVCPDRKCSAQNEHSDLEYHSVGEA